MKFSDLTDCQLCSVVSQTNGEDPIGTASPCDGWLILELPQPWIMERLMSDPLTSEIFRLLKEYEKAQKIRLRPILIAPDRDYSIADKTRIFYYHRPHEFSESSRIDGLKKDNLDEYFRQQDYHKIPFSVYQKQEFLIPNERVNHFIQTLFQKTDKLSQFNDYKQETNHIREIMVCTHGNIDLACSRFGFPIYQQLKKAFTTNDHVIRVWRCSHFGGHRFAPTLLDLPTGQMWGHLEANILNTLIYREGDVNQLRPFYRGWAGLSKFGQILERELWMNFGWPWLNYLKSEEILAQDPHHDFMNADWVELHLNSITPDLKIKQSYQARVEVSGVVETVNKSGEKPILTKQYQVQKWEQIFND